MLSASINEGLRVGSSDCECTGVLQLLSLMRAKWVGVLMVGRVIASVH